MGLVDDCEATERRETVWASDEYLRKIPQQLSERAKLIIQFAGMDAKEILLRNTTITKWKARNRYLYHVKEGT